MRLDAKLEEAHNEVPPSLRMRPLNLSFTDQPFMILNRLYSDLVYLKSVCVLHRKYLSQHRSDPSFGYSRRTCGDAALQILKHQAELHEACQPEGQFHDHRWMLSSLSCHDFLLAAMITCLDLYESHKQSATLCPEDLEPQARKYDALRNSYGIWASRREFSRDARRASSVLAIMLSKIPRPNISAKAAHEMPSMIPPPMDGDTAVHPAVDYSQSSSRVEDGFHLAEQVSLPYDCASPEVSTKDPLNTGFSELDNIDWVRREILLTC